MRIELHSRDGTPIYRQISNQIKYQIASGQIQAGEELPGVRTLAEQLSITPNTVVKAYGELAAEGLIQMRRGSGSYVTESNSPLTRKEQRRILQERVDALLAEASQLNFTFDELLSLIRDRHGLLLRSMSRQGAKEVGDAG